MGAQGRIFDTSTMVKAALPFERQSLRDESGLITLFRYFGYLGVDKAVSVSNNCLISTSKQVSEYQRLQIIIILYF